MKAIFFKEINLFFSSLIGYVVIGVFLLLTSLILWFFTTDFNILRGGYADLSSFFFISPYLFIFLISAITMHSISGEIQLGTLEILKTKPLTSWDIVFGKFLACQSLIGVSLIPTLIYCFSIYFLANPIGNIDFPTLLGSYLGLFFLSGMYVSIGLFCSCFSKNQIVSFLLSAILIYLLFEGFEAFASYNLFGNWDYYIQKIGIKSHYKSISKGVIDSRDLIYFITVTYFFLVLTKFKIDHVN